MRQRQYLSVLSNASKGSITYYVGEDENDVKHLADCTLLCKTNFNPKLDNVDLVQSNNPQLDFYKLSADYQQDYLQEEKLEYKDGYYLHKDALIGKNVTIGKGSVIGKCVIENNVKIHPNSIKYISKKLFNIKKNIDKNEKFKILESELIKKIKINNAFYYELGLLMHLSGNIKKSYNFEQIFVHNCKHNGYI